MLNNALRVLLVLGLVGSLLGCSSSDSTAGQDHTAQCQAITAAECKKIWGCNSAADLPASEFGTDEASCEKVLGADCSDPMPCQDGETWDFANGDECIKQFGAVTCDQYNAMDTPIAACENACKAK